MLNCLQVRNVVAATPEELQEDINLALQELGKRVQDIRFIDPLGEGFACSIIYWSQNIAAEMTAKIEDLPETPKAKDGDPVFVCVIHDYQRDLVRDALIMAEVHYRGESAKSNYNASEQNGLAQIADEYEKLQSRFENDNERPETVETEGYNAS
jgi:hypothetical protein